MYVLRCVRSNWVLCFSNYVFGKICFSFCGTFEMKISLKSCTGKFSLFLQKTVKSFLLKLFSNMYNVPKILFYMIALSDKKVFFLRKSENSSYRMLRILAYRQKNLCGGPKRLQLFRNSARNRSTTSIEFKKVKKRREFYPRVLKE